MLHIKFCDRDTTFPINEYVAISLFGLFSGQYKPFLGPAWTIWKFNMCPELFDPANGSVIVGGQWPVTPVTTGSAWWGLPYEGVGKRESGCRRNQDALPSLII